MTRYSSPGADLFAYSAALMRLDRELEDRRRRSFPYYPPAPQSVDSAIREVEGFCGYRLSSGQQQNIERYLKGSSDRRIDTQEDYIEFRRWENLFVYGG